MLPRLPVALLPCARTFSATDIDTVLIGNPGNPGWPDPYITDGLGAVSYSYRIGKYEVTNAEYKEFLNAVDPHGANVLGLYDSKMSTTVYGGINFSAASCCWVYVFSQAGSC